MRMIGLGLQTYHETHKAFPQITASPLGRDLPPEKRLSWLCRTSMYNTSVMDPRYRLQPSEPWDAEANAFVVSVLRETAQCPSNPNVGEEQNFGHYVGITGVGVDAALLAIADPRCGFMGLDRKITLEDIKDGTATTLAIVETATDNGPWAAAGHSTARGLDPDRPDYLGQHGQFNSFHGRGFPFSSPFVTNACFADASVRGLTDRISLEVFEALATIAGGEKVPPFEP